MDKHYKDIPAQGTHRGETPGQDPSTSVSAPSSTDVTSRGRPVAKTFLHVRHNEEGWQRLSLHAPDNLPEPTSGTTEMGRYTSTAEIRDALNREQDKTKFVVMENTETGEVFYQNQAEIRDDLTADGRFNQFTLFDTQEAAAAYADRRQNEMQQR
jgi:hypothetical protein